MNTIPPRVTPVTSPVGPAPEQPLPATGREASADDVTLSGQESRSESTAGFLLQTFQDTAVATGAAALGWLGGPLGILAAGIGGAVYGHDAPTDSWFGRRVWGAMAGFLSGTLGAVLGPLGVGFVGVVAAGRSVVHRAFA